MKKYINLLLLVLWCLFIFYMSSRVSSVSSSQSFFIEDFIRHLFNINGDFDLTFIVRKSAHFFEYFILGILSLNYFKVNKKYFIISLLFCIIYACRDEIHQAFVPGRACMFSDILLDSFASSLSILLFRRRIVYEKDE